MRPQARERNIFRASRRRWVSTPKFRPRPVASARTAGKDQSPLRGAPPALSNGVLMLIVTEEGNW